MRIVSRAEFMLLPAGTLFSRYSSRVFGNLCVKCETTDYNDFRYQRIADAIAYDDTVEFVELLDKWQETGCSVAMDFEDDKRDGVFDDAQLFAVWDREDVAALIVRLRRALVDGYREVQS